MIEVQKKIFTGHIELLIVKKEAQGLGVGKALVDGFISYAVHGNENAVYVQTDTLCNYGFYEHQGFERLDSTEIALNGDDQITLFLYQYKQGKNLQWDIPAKQYKNRAKIQKKRTTLNGSAFYKFFSHIALC